MCTCVYFDFCKAFDSVSHTKLAQKLVAYGFSGKLLAFIVDFLCERSQQLKLSSQTVLLRLYQF